MNTQAPAFIRTLVPFVVSFVLTRYALPVDGATAQLVVQSVVGYLYYALVHIVELKYPAWGFLLGIAKAPAYSTASAPSPNEGEKVEAVVVPEDVPVAGDGFQADAYEPNADEEQPPV